MELKLQVGPITLALGEQLVVVAVDANRAPPPSRKPSLYKGLRADHLTIPLTPKSNGTFWIHLTYVVKDGERVRKVRKPFAVHSDTLRAFGKEVDATYRQLVQENLFTHARPVDASWLAERGYSLALMDTEEFTAAADDVFKTRRRVYRVSVDRLKQFAGKLAFYDPALLDEESFQEGHPKCIQAISDGDAPTLFVWRFPWGPNGELGWYAAPTDTLGPRPDQFLGALSRACSPRFWDSLRTIMIELGMPADYDKVEFIAEAMKTGLVERIPVQGRANGRLLDAPGG